MSQQVQARFRLIETARVGCYRPPMPGETTGWVPAEGLRVRLVPVSGDPFGSATPSGDISMLIANPNAAAVFANVPLESQFDAVFSLVEPTPAPIPPTPVGETPAEEATETPAQEAAETSVPEAAETPAQEAAETPAQEAMETSNPAGEAPLPPVA